MYPNLTLLDAKKIEEGYLLSSQESASNKLYQMIEGFCRSAEAGSITSNQMPHHVISLMGARGSGKTTVLFNLIDKLRENVSWLVPKLFLPDLVTNEQALGPAIISTIQESLVNAGQQNRIDIREKIEEITLSLAWFPDATFSQDIIARDSISSRDFALQTFQLYGKALRMPSEFKDWLQHLLIRLNKSHMIIVFDDADISIEIVEHLIDFVRYYLSIPQVVAVIAADEEGLQRRILNRRLSALPILSTLPESEGFSLFGASGQDYKRREVENEISYVDALLTKVLPPATRVYLDTLTDDEKLNHRFKLPDGKLTPSIKQLTSEINITSSHHPSGTLLSDIICRTPSIFSENLRVFINQYLQILNYISLYIRGEYQKHEMTSTLLETQRISIFNLDLQQYHENDGVDEVLMRIVRVFLSSPINRPWVRVSYESLDNNVLTIGTIPELLESLCLHSEIVGSDNFRLLYRYGEVRLTEREQRQIFDFILELGVAYGANVEEIIYLLQFSPREPLRNFGMSSNAGGLIQEHLSELSRRLKYFQGSISEQTSGVLGMDPTGGALIPFYITNMQEMGLFVHTSAQFKKLKRWNEMSVEHFERLKGLKKQKVYDFGALERSYLYKVISNLAELAHTYIVSMISIFRNDRSTSFRMRFIRNINLDWGVVEYRGIWESLFDLFSSDEYDLGQRAAFLIFLSEMPYELLVGLTSTRYSREREMALKGLCEFRSQMAQYGLWTAERGFDFTSIDDSESDAPGSLDRFRLQWPGVVWATKGETVNELAGYLEAVQLDDPWDMNTQAPPRWRDWVEKIVSQIDFSEAEENGDHSSGTDVEGDE